MKTAVCRITLSLLSFQLRSRPSFLAHMKTYAVLTLYAVLKQLKHENNKFERINTSYGIKTDQT